MTEPTPIVTEPRHPVNYIDKAVDLHLQWNGLLKAYQVISITSTTWYKPGEWLNEKVVAQCCQTKGWSVSMVHDDWLAKILSIFSGSIASAVSLPKVGL